MSAKQNNRIDELIISLKNTYKISENIGKELKNLSGLMKVLLLCKNTTILGIQVFGKDINVDTSYLNNEKLVLHTFNISDNTKVSNYFDKKLIMNILNNENYSRLTEFNKVKLLNSTTEIFSIKDSKINDYNKLADEMFDALNADKKRSAKGNQSLDKIESLILENLSKLSDVSVSYIYDNNNNQQPTKSHLSWLMSNAYGSKNQSVVEENGKNDYIQSNAVNEVITATIEDVKDCEFLKGSDNIM